MFIVLEGIDGSGKSTAAEFIKNYLEADGRSVILTREPGGSDIAEKLRGLVLDNKNSIDSLTETLLFMAARVNHNEKVIKPALKRGDIVICDRYIESTKAYQGIGKGIDLDFIDYLYCQSDCQEPDHTFYFSVPVSIALSRLRGLDRMEQNGKEFYDSIHNYFEYTFKVKESAFVIDASKSIIETQQQLIKHLRKLV